MSIAEFWTNRRDYLVQVKEMLRDMGPVTRDQEASEEMVDLTKVTLR